MWRFLTLLFVIFVLCTPSPVFGADDAHGAHAPSGPLDLKYDTAIWAVVIFLGLLLVLRSKAWDPILQGLQKREETIRSSLEEAKSTRVEMERMRQQFQKELAEAHQQIPRLMEEARKKGEEMATEMLAKASAQIQGDRDRLRREMEIAKDQALKELWEQAASLATLISAKAIRRALTPEDHRRLLDEALAEMQQTASN